MKPIIGEWMNFAMSDLMAAEQLSGNRNLTTIACFHSQQCVEKCLKAIIELKGIIPPKIHDLIRLYEIANEPFEIEEDMLARLNELYIESRYPPGLGLFPDGPPTTEESKIFFEFAKKIYHSTSEITG